MQSVTNILVSLACALLPAAANEICASVEGNLTMKVAWDSAIREGFVEDGAAMQSLKESLARLAKADVNKVRITTTSELTMSSQEAQQLMYSMFGVDHITGCIAHVEYTVQSMGSSEAQNIREALQSHSWKSRGTLPNMTAEIREQLGINPFTVVVVNHTVATVEKECDESSESWLSDGLSEKIIVGGISYGAAAVVVCIIIWYVLRKSNREQAGSLDEESTDDEACMAS